MLRRTSLTITVLAFLSVLLAHPAVAAEPSALGGGMTASTARSGEQVVADDRPSCRAITYTGPDGRIDVQTTNGIVAWGITMTPSAKSIGRWDVFTYLNGSRTTSAFNRTTTGPYIPHGSVAARSGQSFKVQATVASADGKIYTSVTNICRVP